MIDMAHIAGLVATGAHPSPVPYADIVTSTSHKTLRGRAAASYSRTMRTCSRRSILPCSRVARAARSCMLSLAGCVVRRGPAAGFQGIHQPCGGERRCNGSGMTDGGLRLVSGGTDNHLCLVDLTPADVTGKDAEKLLESVGLTVNKNTIPNEQRSPFVASGIRVGSAAATSRGFTKEDFYEVGQCIAATVFNAADEAKLADVKVKIDAMLRSIRCILAWSINSKQKYKPTAGQGVLARPLVHGREGPMPGSTDRRPSWDEYFMTLANEVATRTTCLRRAVGAIIVKDRRILATGYNGVPTGLAHCAETGCLRQQLGCQAASVTRFAGDCMRSRMRSSRLHVMVSISRAPRFTLPPSHAWCARRCSSTPISRKSSIRTPIQMNWRCPCFAKRASSCVYTMTLCKIMQMHKN